MLHSIRQAGRRRFIRYLVGLGGLATLSVSPCARARVAVQRVRVASHAERTRLVFDLDGPAKHSMFTLKDPHRVVIDLDAAILEQALPKAPPTSSVIKALRSAKRGPQRVRIVLDLDAEAVPTAFALTPNEGRGHRLVVDLQRRGGTAQIAPDRPADAPTKEHYRDIVVAIDPGHGGRDPGAVGRYGTREKDVCLAIARNLAKLVDQQQGMRAVLTRNDDRFVSLRERTRLAHQQAADLFLSIHADSFPDQRARGASVYALSLTGASSEAAKRLADKENAADLLGGISLKDKDHTVASVLLDLSQSATIESSLDVGKDLLNNLGRVDRVHKSQVLQAGFVVLKSPDIPSVLIETAFISNPRDEKKLRTKAHQSKVAQALLRGVKAYFSRRAPPGTLQAVHQQKKLG